MTWLAQNRDRLEGFRSGEPVVLAQVYRHYAGEVAKVLSYGFSFKSAGQACRFHGFTSPFELDDALQETFTKAFAEPARLAYDGLRPYNQYLLTIARNLVIDRMRKLARAPRLFSVGESEDSLQQTDSEPAASPEELAAKRQLNNIIKDFADGLGETERRLFQLRFYETRPRPQVAELLGLSEMQIRTREQKIRKLLLRRLSGSGYGPDSSFASFILCVLPGVW